MAAARKLKTWAEIKAERLSPERIAAARARAEAEVARDLTARGGDGSVGGMKSSPMVTDLLKEARAIWGNEKMSLTEIVVRLQVGLGDLARLARDGREDARNLRPGEEDGTKMQTSPTPEQVFRGTMARELKKELGNVIFSTIRWCDDLGFTPEECIEAAEEAQRKFVASGRRR